MTPPLFLASFSVCLEYHGPMDSNDSEKISWSILAPARVRSDLKLLAVLRGKPMGDLLADLVRQAKEQDAVSARG